jgi:hypothetical protein
MDYNNYDALTQNACKKIACGAGSSLGAILLILSVFSIVTNTTAFAQAAMSTTAQSMNSSSLESHLQALSLPMLFFMREMRVTT